MSARVALPLVRVVVLLRSTLHGYPALLMSLGCISIDRGRKEGSRVNRVQAIFI
jgi:hypothetical protein